MESIWNVSGTKKNDISDLEDGKYDPIWLSTGIFLYQNGQTMWRMVTFHKTINFWSTGLLIFKRIEKIPFLGSQRGENMTPSDFKS